MIVDIKHLYKSYESGNQVYDVLKDINLELKDGEF